MTNISKVCEKKIVRMSSRGRTAYLFEKPATVLPRCRNSHDLAPLFVLLDDAGELVTSPVPMQQVPFAMFWRNTDGYGFDVRNLSVLLRVNFRNLNPHTVHDASPRPIWCNADDLNSLLYHPAMDENVRATAHARATLLNLLSDRSKTVLASAARELYSSSLQGFYDWVADQPEFNSLMRAMGLRASQDAVMAEIVGLQQRRRAATVAGIESHLGIQAAEHFCEPAGVERESELYQILEFYKAGIAQQLIDYLQHRAANRREISQSIQATLQAYRETRMTAIARRYAQAFRNVAADDERPGLARHMQYIRELLIWHLIFHVSGSAAIHVRLFYTPPTCDYVVRINDISLCVAGPGGVLKLLDDMIPHVLDARRTVRVSLASLGGGLASVCRCLGHRWKHTMQSDNMFLQSLANTWAMHTTFTEYIDSIIVQRHTGALWIPSPQARIKHMFAQQAGRFRDGMHHSITKHMALSALQVFEFELLNLIELAGGYDDFHGTLLDKLRAAMSNRTCIQDVAGELCELLSVPFPPERADTYARFQCDHTNIPRLIVQRTPAAARPATAFVPRVYLEYRSSLRRIAPNDGGDDGDDDSDGGNGGGVVDSVVDGVVDGLNGDVNVDYRDVPGDVAGDDNGDVTGDDNDDNDDDNDDDDDDDDDGGDINLLLDSDEDDSMAIDVSLQEPSDDFVLYD